MNPLVSIIVPAYNRADHIVACIESVCKQTYRPIELIIVDDGSTDDTLAVCESHKSANHDSHFRMIVLSQSNNGAPAARNNGFRKSSGEYIIFLDSDDTLLPHKVEAEVKVLEDNGYDYVYSDALIIRSGINTGEHLCRPLSGDTRDYFLYSWQTMCATYKKDFLEEMGPWNELLSINQDWEFCIRAVLKSRNCGFIAQVHQHYHEHSGGRIGDELDFNRINGKENAAWVVWNRLNELHILDVYLLKGFRKRFLLCALNYSVMGERKRAKDLLLKMYGQGLINRLLLMLFLGGIWTKGANIILSIHRSVVTRSRRRNIAES